MADDGLKKPIQNAHRSNEINFGHPGTSTYHGDTQSWSFLRIPRSDSKEISGEQTESCNVKILRPPVPVIEGRPCADTCQDSIGFLSATHFQNLVPEVASILSHDGGTEALGVRLFDRKSIQTSLLDFGSALVLGNNDVQSGSQSAPVAAYVLASESDRLVLTLLDTETIPYNVSATHSIQVPFITSAQSAQFIACNGTIQQISFSHGPSLQQFGWLAVRQTGATSVLQPLLHRAAAQSAGISSLDPNVIVEIPISRTGYLSHADVQFYPNDPSRIAIIDIGGNWSIWKLSGIRSRSARILHRLHLIAQGSLVSQPEEDRQFDGWHKLTWMCDTNLLLVCNRQSIALFSDDGRLLVTNDVQVGRRFEGPVLDILPIRNGTCIAVLTAVHVYLVEIKATADGKNSNGSHKISTKVFWNHARGADDSTLKLYALAFSNTTLLFLVSNATKFVTFYQLHTGSDDITVSSISDPMWLDVTYTDDVNLTFLNIRSIATDSSQSISLKNTTFFKIFTQNGTGSICEVLCQFQYPGCVLNQDSRILPLPKKLFLHHGSGYRIVSTVFEDDLDGFTVVDDMNDSVVTEPLLDTVSNHQGTPESAIHQARTCDLHLIYDALVAKMQSTRSENATSIDDVLDIAASVAQGSKIQTLLQLISGISEADLSTIELERDSHSLEIWAQELEGAEYSGTNEEHSGHLQHSRIWTRQSLLEIYEDLVQFWLSSLSDAVSDRFRVQRERLLRQVALDLFLSSTIIGPSSQKQAINPPDVPQNDSHLDSSQVLPTNLLDIDEADSSAPEFEEESTDGEKQSMLLSFYTSFQTPRGAVKTSSTSITHNILSHLPTSFDADPDNYSYNDAELSVALTRNELAAQELDPKARRKAERLARARKKQIEKQAQMKKSAFERSTALPSIMSSQLPIRGVQSSQAAPISSSQPSGTNVPLLSMTQPERGAYGKRDVKKIKGKGKANRQQGF